MKATSVYLFFQLAGVAWAQIASGTASTNGVSISYETRLEPPTPGVTRFGGGTLGEKSVIKRHLCDFVSKKYFGYDVTPARLEDGRISLIFSPLTITPQRMEKIFDEVKGWTLLPLPQHLTTQFLRGGEVLALDLFINPSTGQKIVDYLTIRAEGRSVMASGPARDFSVEDGSIQISGPRLSINGKFQEPTANSWGTVIGPSVWIYIDTHGRFIFSLLPRLDLGFQKAGEIRGSAMTWRSGGDEFSLNADKPIASGGGAYNLYVFHDLGYRLSFSVPAGSGDKSTLRFIMGAESLKSIFKR